MSEMSRAEAIEILQALKFIVDFEDYSDRLEVAIDMAIVALKEETICPILSDNEVKQPCIKSPCGIEQPHGEWNYHKEWAIDGECAFECSKCGMGTDVDYNFCPNCGASMQANDRQVTGKLNSEIEKSKSEIVPDYRDGWRLKDTHSEYWDNLGIAKEGDEK